MCRIYFGRIVVLAVVSTQMLAVDSNAYAQQRYFGVPNFPRSSWRGRVYIRNGPIAPVYREHWGNGVTSNGLALGTAAINGFVAAAPSIATMVTGLPAAAGPGNGTGFDNTSSLVAPEPLDPGASQREKVLAGIEERQTKLLTQLGFTPEQLAPKLPASTLKGEDASGETGIPGALKFGS